MPSEINVLELCSCGHAMIDHCDYGKAGCGRDMQADHDCDCQQFRSVE